MAEGISLPEGLVFGRLVEVEPGVIATGIAGGVRKKDEDEEMGDLGVGMDCIGA